MKDSIKSALISAFVYPGAGHFFLKNKLIGTILARSFSVPLFIVIDDKYTKVTHIIQQVINNQGLVDIVALTNKINQTIYMVDSTKLKYSLIVLIIIWLIAIIDSYRLGLKQSNSQKRRLK